MITTPYKKPHFCPGLLLLFFFFKVPSSFCAFPDFCSCSTFSEKTFRTHETFQSGHFGQKAKTPLRSWRDISHPTFHLIIGINNPAIPLKPWWHYCENVENYHKQTGIYTAIAKNHASKSYYTHKVQDFKAIHTSKGLHTGPKGDFEGCEPTRCCCAIRR